MVAGRAVFWRENYRPAIFDFCNNIGGTTDIRARPDPGYPVYEYTTGARNPRTKGESFCESGGQKLL
jgi:hypothetical protein